MKKSLPLWAMLLKRCHIFSFLAVILMTAGVLSCSPIDLDFETGSTPAASGYPSRGTSAEYRKVFLLYSAGFHNLSDDFDEDVNDLIGSNLPTSPRDVILVFSHRTKTRYNYKDQTSPTLTRIRMNYSGEIIRDTLMTMSTDTPSASSETLREILTYVHAEYPAESYGMMFSSHGTGWIPPNYKFSSSSTVWKAGVHDSGFQSCIYGPRPDGLPEVRSIGYQAVHGGTALEIDIKDFADAIPMYLDYIIFDACLMGCIEVAYQLRNKCSHVVCSPAEILAEGMDYKTLTDYLIHCSEPDLYGFADNYYLFYSDPKRSSSYRSGTITLVDCTKIEGLVPVCKELFEKYREPIMSLQSTTSKIQKYYTMEAHKCFYDMEDILIQAGVADEEFQQLESALSECIEYRASTDYILGKVKVEHYSGLSMYVPLSAYPELNQYYKTLDWNIDTDYVK